ncbi:DsbC family protein [Thioalbus denitrificans]|uniref:Thiol:disulfide interchange protein n=1 Tax=Thioalbus denitrificans TaxID=547122 RepID=A0A369C348_9GAMM|nr:DsbC family protein [Thioalbus denitrificans]RCX28001.1 thiol:disulfide interchange protein DsbC [Thioalbus denitrificans]
MEGPHSWASVMLWVVGPLVLLLVAIGRRDRVALTLALGWAIAGVWVLWVVFGPTSHGVPDGVDPVAAAEQAVRAALPGTRIETVTPTPIPGLMEVVAGPNVLYVDRGGQWLVVGHLYDLRTATDLTAARKAELEGRVAQAAEAATVPWDALPRSAMLGFGAGAREIAVLADPDCPWCRRLHRELRASGDLRVHAVLVPRSQDAMRRILCAAEPLAALDAAMAGESLPEPPGADCETAAEALDDARAFVRRHALEGTPILIAPDGRVHPGYLEPAPLRAWLDAVPSKEERADEKDI